MIKLFTRYNRINLLATVAVFLLSAIAFYFLLRYILINQIDEDLKIEQREIETYAQKYQRLPEIIQVRDQQTDYTKVDNNGGRRTFSSFWNRRTNDRDTENFRKLLFYIPVQGQWYKVTVNKSLEETDGLITSIVSITLITILIILIMSVFINRFVLRKLWQPFYQSLEIIRNFQLGKNMQLNFPDSSIEEFHLMNETLAHTTKKANDDYQYLKEFTENASHELQTPLAIIRSKMDVLIQDDQLSEVQSKTVQGAYEAIQRLSRLNQGLLLLTKIENGQYQEKMIVSPGEKVKDKLAQFEEMITAKNLNVSMAVSDTNGLLINPSLFDIILNNLFGNAIKYTPEGGAIEVLIASGRLEINNSAEGVALDETRLFRRFSKSGKMEEGIGLGLAIVRQAAEASGFSVQYRHDRFIHHFIVTGNNYQS